MAESDTNPTEAAQPQFALQRVYLKDVSFETPNGPQAFTQEWQPDIDVQLHSEGNRLGEDVFEVVLGITVTAKLEEKVAYLVEVHQAGIFTLNGFEEVHLGHMLGAYCPNILFPYAREAVSDLVSKGSFPQLLLTPVNFDALYAEHLQSQQQQAGHA